VVNLFIGKILRSFSQGRITFASPGVMKRAKKFLGGQALGGG